jgi:hypothetical protein
MKKIQDVDVFASGRPNLSEREREKLLQEKYEQQKAAGYQQLVELCALGEYEAAKQLANRNPNWGYEVVDGVAIEKTDI